MMKHDRTILLATGAVVLAGLRIGGVKHEAFQATAHLYVGGLLGAWAITAGRGDPDHGCLALAIFLSVVEVICFLTFRQSSM